MVGRWPGGGRGDDGYAGAKRPSEGADDELEGGGFSLFAPASKKQRAADDGAGGDLARRFPSLRGRGGGRGGGATQAPRLVQQP